MNYFFYAEGHSEYNFVEVFFRHRNIPFTKNISQIINKGGSFLKNCGGSSNIYNELKITKRWINEVSNSLVVIVADTNSLFCYTKFKEKIEIDLTELNINKNFKVINSKPELEQVYLEDKKLLKKVIRSYHNHKSTKKIDFFDELKKSDLLTENCNDRYVTKKILEANNIPLNKAKFAKRFFTNAFKQNSKISIMQRIESIIPV